MINYHEQKYVHEHEFCSKSGIQVFVTHEASPIGHNCDLFFLFLEALKMLLLTLGKKFNF